MSFFRSTIDTLRSSSYLSNPFNGFFQIRNASKRVSGSKTNKNDSAGRRLGPKVFESHFVKPGQIIMRQRGTKIHPGENCGIGKDHTIFALEPGYVRFYYDPFHPLRKYVGVALRKHLTLPTPHFESRVRRFGYEEITDSEEALKEESHMSRKEYLQQPELMKQKQKALKKDEFMLSHLREQLPSFMNIESESDMSITTNKLLNVCKLMKLGKSIEDANAQANYYYVYELQLAKERSDISPEQFKSLKSHYLNLTSQLESTVAVDFTGNLCKYLSPEQRSSAKKEIISTLNKEYTNKLIGQTEKDAIRSLIETPLIFSRAEQSNLTKQYLPNVLPETIEETVISNINTKKPPKGTTIVRKFDSRTRDITTIGRTKNAFLL